MVVSRHNRLARSRRRYRPSLETLEARRVLATYFVDSTTDDPGGTCLADIPSGGGCTLRAAIAAAEATPVADTIQIADGTYTIDPSFGSFDLQNAFDVAFVGSSDPAAVILDGDFQSRVFDIFGGGSPYNVSFQGLTIRNGIADDTSGGGGINASSDANLTLTNVIVENNEARLGSSGGGINASGNLTIVSSAVRNNTAANNGGGIDFSAATGPRTLEIRNSTISGNATGSPGDFGYGGGIFVDDSDASAIIDSVTISGNRAGDSGGGIYVRLGEISVLNGSNFLNNQALGSISGGGGLYVFGAGPASPGFTVIGGRFEGNTAVLGAGGLESFEAPGSIDGTIFRLNQVVGTGTGFDSGGGAIAILANNPANAPSLSIDSVLVDQNTAPAAGGIAAVNANVSITGSTILNNTATLTSAGGIGVSSATGNESLVVSNSSILGNTAALDAGGIGSAGMDVIISGGSVANNVAQTGRAGGIGIQNTSVRPQIIAGGNLQITDNTSDGDGGGLGVDGADADLANVQFSGNQSTNGRGDGIALDNPAGTSIAVNVTDADGIFVAENTELVTRTSTFGNSIIGGTIRPQNGITTFSDALQILPTGVLRTDATGSGGDTVLTINDGTLLNNQGLIQLTTINAPGNAVIATNSGPLVNGPQGTIEVLSGIGGARSINSSLNNQGVVNVLETSLTIAGNTNNAGSLRIGSSLVVSNTGTFTQGLSGLLELSISGQAGIDSARMDVGGNADFTGTLDLILDQGASFTPGDAVTVINFASSIGSFDPVLGNDLGGGLFLNPVYDTNELVLEVSSGSAPPKLVVQDVSVNEDAGSVDVQVSVDSDVGSPFTVDFTTADLTANSADDYTPQSGTLNFNGLASDVQTITIPIGSDLTTELDETFQILFSGVLPDTLSLDVSDIGIVTILNDDSASLIISDVSGFEDDGPLTFEVTLQGSVDTSVSVSVATLELPGEATAGVDYLSDSDTLVFLGDNGEVRTFLVSITPDVEFESDELFAVDLFNVVAGGRSVSIVSPGQGIGTILNDDASADLSVTKSDSADPVSPGDTFTYTLVVTNNGPDTATSVILDDSLPLDVTFIRGYVDGDESAVSFLNGSVVASIPSLGSGSSATVQITVTVSNNARGDLVNVASVSAAESDPSLGNNSATETTTVTTPPATLVGHVYCDLNGNAVEDFGEAVVGTTVFLDQNGNRLLDSGERSTLTDSEGDYVFDNITDPTLTVVAVVPQGCLSVPSNPGIVRSTVGVGAVARGLAATDLDGDGDPDLMIVGDLSNSLTTLINDAGDFRLGAQTSVASRPQSIATLPNRTSPFAAIAGIGSQSDGGSVVLVSGNSIVSEFSVGNGPIDVAIDDFDRNGVPDLVVAAFRSSDVHLILNEVLIDTPIATARQVTEVETGDVNEDGAADLLIGGFGYVEDPTSELAVQLGDGAGGFAPSLFADVPSGLVDLAVGPFDRRAAEPNNVIFALSAGNLVLFDVAGGLLQQVGNVDVAGDATSMGIGDFNRDGLTDVAVASFNRQTIDIYIGNGLGQFALVSSVEDVSSPSDLVVADFDKDDSDDIAIANFYGELDSRFVLPSTVTILYVDLAESAVVISGGSVAEVDFAFPNADPEIRFDVTRDGRVTALDALQVINRLQATGAEGESIGQLQTDVNQDGRTSALDALLIINHMDRTRSAGAEGTGSISDQDDEDDRFAAVDLYFMQF